ncbi:hypothetical protein IFM89_005097 [Coptis chinensis]|uniref:Uncharacterized protein n=1 Tax=Coptis chinensis TaxID=261450 RepID=A0A835IM41_9MAGN|nr:hypothetical protein IFM89_005097 [Coptis chinensis]
MPLSYRLVLLQRMEKRKGLGATCAKKSGRISILTKKLSLMKTRTSSDIRSSSNQVCSLLQDSSADNTQDDKRVDMRTWDWDVKF